MFSFGESFHGSVPAEVSRPLLPASVRLEATPDRRGYFVLTEDGEVHAFGASPSISELTPSLLAGERVVDLLVLAD